MVFCFLVLKFRISPFNHHTPYVFHSYALSLLHFYSQACVSVFYCFSSASNSNVCLSLTSLCLSFIFSFSSLARTFHVPPPLFKTKVCFTPFLLHALRGLSDVNNFMCQCVVFVSLSVCLCLLKTLAENQKQKLETIFLPPLRLSRLCLCFLGVIIFLFFYLNFCFSLSLLVFF